MKHRRIYVLGTGAVGLPLAAFLSAGGRDVVAVRTSVATTVEERMTATIRGGQGSSLSASMATTSLSALESLDGIVALTTKAYANPAVAAALREKEFAGPLVIMQNGLGVEEPFIEAMFPEVYRCVLYVTSQTEARHEVLFRPVASCPIGIVRGRKSQLEEIVATLTTPRFEFHADELIERAVWTKAIINSVFNSICPLLEVDNGIFTRDEDVAVLSGEVVRECLVLAAARGISLGEPEVMARIKKISSESNGVFISTLQDIRAGRETEIESLNLAMARLAAALEPPVPLFKTELLGRLILAKSKCRKISPRISPCLPG